MRMIRFAVVAAAAIAVGIPSVARSTFESPVSDTEVNPADPTLGLTLDEMNCISSDSQVTNSIPCSTKGTNWGKPAKKRRK